MAGSNLDEGTLFYGMEPRIMNQNEEDLRRRTARIVPEKGVPDLIEAYRQALENRLNRPPTPGEIYVAITGDSQFRLPGLRMVAAQQKLGTPAYSYLFDYVGTAAALGSCHSLEVGFVFGSTNREFHGTGPVIDRLTLQMQEAWTAFARTGCPTCSSLGEWPEYGRQRRTMILGQYSRVAEAPYETERRAWDKIENKWLG
jgi:para-nitrobenzyl esterase